MLPSETLIFAIETSCDETAAAIINGEGEIIADVVASQIDFHARFGGVVPEIASRKHVEAIAGVAFECLEQARETLQNPDLTWKDLSAVAATYAPGLVGALVVGLAFAKGLAWSCRSCRWWGSTTWKDTSTRTSLPAEIRTAHGGVARFGRS